MTTPEKREKLHKLLDLALDINEYKETSDDELPKALFSFAGHCGRVDIAVFARGWKRESEPFIKEYCYLDFDGDIKRMDRIIEKMEIVKELLYPSKAECIQCDKTGVKEDMLKTPEGYVCEDCIKE